MDNVPSGLGPTDRVKWIGEVTTELHAAAQEYMAACPADEDLNDRFQAATNRLRAALSLRMPFNPIADAAPKLLEACRAQHRAIDTLMALLVIADPKFRPTQNPEIWRATLQGHEAINQASGVA